MLPTTLKTNQLIHLNVAEMLLHEGVSIYYNRSSLQTAVWGLTFAYNSQEIPTTQWIPQSKTSTFMAKLVSTLERLESGCPSEYYVSSR